MRTDSELHVEDSMAKRLKEAWSEQLFLELWVSLRRVRSVIRARCRPPPGEAWDDVEVRWMVVMVDCLETYDLSKGPFSSYIYRGWMHDLSSFHRDAGRRGRNIVPLAASLDSDDGHGALIDELPCGEKDSSFRNRVETYISDVGLTESEHRVLGDILDNQVDWCRAWGRDAARRLGVKQHIVESTLTRLRGRFRKWSEGRRVPARQHRSLAPIPGNDAF